MKLVKLAARSAAIVIACISAAIAAPFQNGSFEIGTDPGGSFLTLPNGDSTDITGWTVIGGDIDYIGGYWQAAQGSRSLDLIGDQFVGGVQQTFDTIPGATYSVSFEMAGNPAGGPTIRPLAVTVAGTTNNFTFDITGATLTNMNWTMHQFTFVATGTAETIQFVSDLTGDPAGCCYGAALDNVQIVGLPDLTIVKSHSGNFTQGQTGATYTITVTNAGAGPTSGTVSVIDSIPSGLIATAIGGSGWNCVLGTLTCTRSDSLDPGLSYPDITLTVTAATNAPALVTNTATVSGGGDINPGNNSSSDSTIIVQVAGLALSKTHTGSFTQGQIGEKYTLTVTNTGAGPTAGAVTVTDTLPAGLTATGFSGGGWSCSVVPLSCTRSDALGAGASYPSITLTVNVAVNAPSVVTNTALATGGGAPPAPSNTANDATQIAPAQIVHTAIPTLQDAMLALLSLCLLSLAALRLRNRRA